MRILHVIPSLAPETGGTAFSVANFCEAQARAGAGLTIFTTLWPRLKPFEGGEILERLERSGVQVKLFPTKPAPLNLSLPHSPLLVENVRDRWRGFDLAVIHSLWNPVVTGSMRHLRRLGFPYVLMPHGMLDPIVFERHGWRKRVWAWGGEKSNVEDAEVIIFNSRAEEEKARACGWKFKKTFVFPHIVDLAYWKALPSPFLFEEKFPLIRGREVILFVGRLNWVKNLDRLVDALAIVRARKPTAVLVLVGPDTEGTWSQLEAQAGKLGVKDAVLFTGLLEGENLKAAYARGNVLALVSEKENFGLAAAEALAAGLPVVISEGVDLGRDWESRGPIRRVAPHPEFIAEAILDLLDRSAVVGSPDPEARALAERLWGNPHSSMQDLLGTFQEIIGNRSRQDFSRQSMIREPAALEHEKVIPV